MLVYLACCKYVASFGSNLSELVGKIYLGIIIESYTLKMQDDHSDGFSILVKKKKKNLFHVFLQRCLFPELTFARLSEKLHIKPSRWVQMPG